MVIYSDNIMEGNLDKYGDVVRKLVDLKKSKKFRIGSTSSLENALTYHIDKHKMKNLYVLYKTDNYNRAQKMEKKLMERFSKIKNCENEEDQIGGN
jgi:hypothetical protein